jgi:ankyrin repeat protein
MGCHESLCTLLAHGADVNQLVKVSICIAFLVLSELFPLYNLWTLETQESCHGLSSHCGVVASSQWGRTALMHACARGQIECVTTLIANGADVNMATEASHLHHRSDSAFHALLFSVGVYGFDGCNQLWPLRMCDRSGSQWCRCEFGG